MATLPTTVTFALNTSAFADSLRRVGLELIAAADRIDADAAEEAGDLLPQDADIVRGLCQAALNRLVTADINGATA